jgi:phosphoglycolate phosphatase
LLPLFEITRCADETADKPHPLMLEQILAATNVAPERALMIGDTEYDVAMARALGMPALGVACGVHAPERLLQAGAEAVLETVRAIPAWLTD